MTRTISTITDPETGRTYVVPAGAADDATAETTDAAGETPTDDDGSPDNEQQDEQDDDGRAGGERQLRADLVRERRQRQELQREIAELRQAQETEDETRQREAAEVAALREQAETGVRMLREAAVETAAGSAGFIDPTEVAALLDYAGDLATIEVNPTTGVDRETVEHLVEQLAERKPHLIAAGDRQRYDRGGSDTQGTNGSTSTDDPNASFGQIIRQRLDLQARR